MATAAIAERRAVALLPLFFILTRVKILKKRIIKGTMLSDTIKTFVHLTSFICGFELINCTIFKEW